METVELVLDEQNELVFQVVVEGASSAAKVRLALEGPDGVSFYFPATSLSGGEVTIDMPSMKKMLPEGKYPAKLEVIAEERYFEPLQFLADFANVVKVEAASIVQVNEGRKRRKASEPKVTVVSESQRKPLISVKTKGRTVREAAKALDETKPVEETKSEKKSAAESLKNLSESDLRAALKLLLADKK